MFALVFPSQMFLSAGILSIKPASGDLTKVTGLRGLAESKVELLLPSNRICFDVVWSIVGSIVLGNLDWLEPKAGYGYVEVMESRPTKPAKRVQAVEALVTSSSGGAEGQGVQ